MSLFIIAATILVVIGAGKLFRYRMIRKKKGTPFNQKLERFPGQRLLTRLDALNLESSIQAASICVLPIAIYAAYISALHFGRRPPDLVESLLTAALAIALMGYALYKLRGLLKERHNIRRGCEAMMIVGQALNRLMLSGYQVYHDFPAEDDTIDHVLVGARGIFAVATKTRAMSAAGLRQEDATVAYDGRALHFPNGTDIQMIEQAKGQSKWLANWLSRELGQDITVRAIVALPGWFVKRTSSKGLPVVNPQQFDSLFEHIPPRPLSDETIIRIVYHLDRRGQSMEPV